MDKLTIDEYLEIIAGAPASLEKKTALLAELKKADIEIKDMKRITKLHQSVISALERLYYIEQEKSRLQLLCFDTDKPEEILTASYPVLSYSHALQLIREEYGNEDEPDYGLNNSSEYYFKLELYDITDKEQLLKQYEYACTANGEVQYFKNVSEFRSSHKKSGCNDMFWGYTLEDLLTPYQPGDILYIDCTPYLQPVYCLIYYVCKETPSDCCGLRCLYPGCNGLIEEGALKHGHFYPQNEQYYFHGHISPLFRAELYQGKLPELYAFMAPVSKALKNNPSLMDRIDFYFRQHREVNGISQEDLIRLLKDTQL